MTIHPDAVRQPAVAGRFYPGNAADLRAELHSLLLTAESHTDNHAGHHAGIHGNSHTAFIGSDTDGEIEAPRVLVVPHAGYVFSGPIAAVAYATLRGTGNIQRVVVLGPSHRIALRGMALSSSTMFDTPLGRIPLDTEARQTLLALPLVQVNDEAHAQEHSLEVQLPFLQQMLGMFTLVPVVVGDATAEEVAQVISALWRDDTLIVISTDLSHYHDYLSARRIDAHTIERILELDTNLNGNEACGCRPLNGLLQVLKEKDLEIELLDARNSGDTAGARDQVVGYASFIVH